jgi:hypothetical protein
MDSATVVARLPAMRSRHLTVAFALIVAGLSAACGGEDCNTIEPAYVGDASDEAWRVLLDARLDAQTSGDVPVFTSPASGSALPADASPTFTWESPLRLAAASLPTVAPARRAPRGLLEAPFQALSGLFIPAARAHLPPVTGDIYFLEVDVPGRTCPVAGLTTADLSFTFATSDWEAIAAGGGARTARLMSAFLVDNRVTEGPFLAAPLTFSIAAE